MAGEVLWTDLEDAVSATRVTAGDIFAPDYCDLREEWRKPQSEPLDELVQHLRDLGYFTTELDQENNEKPLGPQDEQVLVAALRSYYADQDRFEEWFNYKLSAGESGVPKNVFRDHVLEDRLKHPLVVKYDTLARLRALMTLDGKVEFRHEPEIGEISLRTRLIHHLLRLYGVLPASFKPDTAYGQRSLQALQSLRSLNGLKARDTTRLRLINGLNCFDKVTEIFAAQFEGASVCIPAPSSGADWSKSIEKQREALHQSFSANRVVNVRAHNAAASVDWPPPDWNFFGIRFLQVYLWHRGHYFGEIDGLWGAVSQDAFESALMTHGLPHESMRRWRPGKTAGYWMEHDGSYYLDAAAVVRACSLISDDNVPKEVAMKSPDDIFEIQEAIDKQMTGFRASDQQKQDAWAEVFNAADGELSPKKGRRRRNYALGIIGRGIRRILSVAKMVWDSLKSFIKGIVGAIRGAARQAMRFLRRVLTPAMQTAKLAARRVIRMFTGAPYLHAVTEDRWVLTKFSFDQDALTLGSQNLRTEDAEAHFISIRDENRALDVVIRLGLKVLEIASCFTPPLSGFKTIQLAWRVLSMVWDFFRQLQTEFREEPVPWRTGMLMTT